MAHLPWLLTNQIPGIALYNHPVFNNMFILQVVDFIDCESGLPMSGVMQPLTSICGLISVISSDFILPFEKLLFWDVKMAMLYRQDVRNAESSHCLVSGHKCKPVSEPAEQPTHPEVLIRLLGSQNDLKGKLGTHCHVL